VSALRFVSMALVLLTGLPGAALALDQGERQLSIAVGPGHLRQAGDGRTGLAGGLELQWAVRDGWAVRGALDMLVLTDGGDTAATRLGLGGTWAFDVLRIVPFVQAGVTVLDLRADGFAEQALGAEAALGAHYFLDRRWVLALVARGSAWPLHLAGDDPGGASPKLVGLELRLGRIF
jgi:hypothetical protein